MIHHLIFPMWYAWGNVVASLLFVNILLVILQCMKYYIFSFLYGTTFITLFPENISISYIYICLYVEFFLCENSLSQEVSLRNRDV